MKNDELKTIISKESSHPVVLATVLEEVSKQNSELGLTC